MDFFCCGYLYFQQDKSSCSLIYQISQQNGDNHATGREIILLLKFLAIYWKMF